MTPMVQVIDGDADHLGEKHPDDIAQNYGQAAPTSILGGNGADRERGAGAWLNILDSF